MLLDLNPTADPGLTRLSAEKLSYANAFGLTLDMTQTQIRERIRQLFERDSDRDPSLQQLCDRVQGSSESLWTFAFMLSLWGQACLKDIPPKVLPPLLTEHFIYGVRSARLRDHLFEVKPDSLNDALLVPSDFIDEDFECESGNLKHSLVFTRCFLFSAIYYMLCSRRSPATLKVR